MLRNYFLVAWRSLWKNRIFSLITIGGLALSMSVCLLLIVLIVDQYSYDSFHQNKDQIYRIRTDFPQPNGAGYDHFAIAPLALGKELAATRPDLEYVVPLIKGFNGNIGTELKAQSFSGLYAGEDFFEMFSFPLLEGDPATALQEPMSLVLSASAAKRLFGDETAMGRTVKREGELFIIKGIMADIPHNSHIQADVITGLSTAEALEGQDVGPQKLINWQNFWLHFVYIQIKPGADLADIETNSNALALQNRPEEELSLLFHTQALSEITPGGLLSNTLGWELPEIAIWFLSLFAIVLIGSATFNYANLSFARALRRAQEVGIRKTVGAGRRHIMGQMVAESLLHAGIAFLIALSLLQLIMPGFKSILWLASEYVRLELTLTNFAVFVAFTFVIGCLAGVLPALHISRFQPIQALKNLKTVKGFSFNWLRSGLLVVQFTISLIFIVSSLVLFNQFDYIMRAEYGFKKEGLYVVEN
ncbi:MAG: ABC transporter permease, partial [Bacteroidota bacterium]